MKLINFTKYLACSALLISLASCENNDYSVIENAVYIAEAAPSDKFNQQIENLVIDDTDVELKLTIRLASPVNENINVSVALDPSLIDAYNQKNSTAFELLPEAYRKMEQSTVIPAGEITGEPFVITIKPYMTPNNESYALPIRISTNSNGISTAGNADKLLYLFKTPNKQKTVILGGAEQRVSFKNSFPASKWTFEYWIKVNNITGRPTGSWEGVSNREFRAQIFTDNAAPIHLEGSESVLLRYWADGVLKIAPTLQCQLAGPFFDSSEFWWPDTWYHIAYTYDGSTLTLYKNGVVDTKLIVSKNFNFSKLILCSGMGRMQVEFAQIRLWNECLPSNLIKDGMSSQIPSDAPGLVGYWKCNEGEGRILKDCTSNENHIDFTQSHTNVTWNNKIYNFSDPNKKE